MFLLDTNVISETRRKRPHGAVLQWLATAHISSLNASVVSVGEIQEGIELTRRNDKLKTEEIEAWLSQVIATFTVLPIDAQIMRLWAKLMHRQSSNLSEDAMIAATALVHNLTVVTRNVGDFEAFGVKVFNPFES